MLEDIFRKLQWDKKYGIIINSKRLTNLRFADDVVLFAKTPTELQQMLHDLNKISNSDGLFMNHNKTKLLTNGPPRRIEVQGTEIQ